jgi:hypothetical protein
VNRATKDDGMVYTAKQREGRRYQNGPGAALRALAAAGSEAELVRVQTTTIVERAINADTPVRLSYDDYKTLKQVYQRDGEKLVYAVQSFYYGSGGTEPITMAFATRAAAEQLIDRLGSGQHSVVVGPLGKFLPPLVLGEGAGAVIMDPFHKT